jgi:hypothetical protein
LTKGLKSPSWSDRCRPERVARHRRDADRGIRRGHHADVCRMVMNHGVLEPGLMAGEPCDLVGDYDQVLVSAGLLGFVAVATRWA